MGPTVTMPRMREIQITEHAARNGFASGERTWVLGAEALAWREGVEQGHIPYRDVAEMRLLSFGLITGVRYQCVLRTRDGARFRICSHHYRNLGNSEDRTASYGPFIRELALRVARHAPGTRFVAGSTTIWFLLSIAAISLVALLTGGAALGGDSWWAYILAALVTPAVIHQIWQHRSAIFNPNDPPRKMLGGEG